MIRNILLLLSLLCVLPGNAAPPFFSVPQYHESVKIDGQADEKAWENSFTTTNFLNTDNAALEPEQTQVRLFHDSKKLYIYCRMEAFVLDPASNQRNLFRAEQKERDSDVWSDDSIELRLRNQENGTPYYICINALGTILDMSDKGGHWDKNDQGPIEGAAVIGNGFYAIECAIDLRKLPGSDPEHFQLNIIRFNQAKKTTSSWIRLADGDRQSPANFALLELSPDHAAVQFPVIDNLTLQRGDLTCTLSGTTQNGSYLAELLSGSRPRARKRGEAVPGLFHVTIPEAKGNQLQLQISVFDAQKKLLARSSTYDYTPIAEEIKINLSSDQPFNLWINDKAAGTQITSMNDQVFPIHPGANLIAVESSSGAKISGSVTLCGETYPVDSHWKLGVKVPPAARKLGFNDTLWPTPTQHAENGVTMPQATGRILLRRTFLYKSTQFTPLPSGNSWKLTQNGTYALVWSGGTIPGWQSHWKLPDWKLILDVPKSLKFLGTTTPRYRLAEKANGINQPILNEELYQYREIAPGRYEIKATRPLGMLGESASWLETIITNDDSLLLLFQANSPQGSSGTLAYHAESADGAYVELPNQLSVEILPPLAGQAPKQLSIAIKARDGGMADEILAQAYFDTLKSAGVNEIIGDCYTDYLKKIGVKNYNFFTLFIHPNLAGPMDEVIGRLYQNFDDAQGRWGETRTIGVNPYFIAKTPECRPYLSESIAAYQKFYPSISGLWYDYEFSPFPVHLMHHPSFSTGSIAEFARQYQIKEPLDHLKIQQKYSEEWIDFSCQAVADFFGVLRQSAQEHQLPLAVYSGYQGDPICRSNYNIDWRKAGSRVDRAYCGYGRDGASIAATRRSLGKAPLVGSLLKMGNVAQTDTAATMIRMALETGGGVLLWYENRFDGSTLTQISTASRVLAQAEDFILNGKRNDSRIVAPEAIRNQMALYEWDGKICVLLLNEQPGGKQTYRFFLKNSRGDLHNPLDGSIVNAEKEINLTVDPGDAMVWFGK